MKFLMVKLNLMYFRLSGCSSCEVEAALGFGPGFFLILPREPVPLPSGESTSGASDDNARMFGANRDMRFETCFMTSCVPDLCGWSE